jgi:hypothetical protein
MLLRGCHTDRSAPVGSAITDIRPASGTSNGSTISLPSSSFALAALASASSTVT